MKKLIASMAFCTMAVAGPASAATISGFAGETANDVTSAGYSEQWIANAGYGTITEIGDLDSTNNPNDVDGTVDPTLRFGGDTWIFGRVFNEWRDRFTIDATDQIVDLVFWAVGGSNIDFDVAVDGSSEGTITGTGQQIRVDNVSGMVEVTLFGGSQGSNSRWVVDVMNIDVVPLPASSLLLLGGLGGLAAMRRRKKA